MSVIVSGLLVLGASVMMRKSMATRAAAAVAALLVFIAVVLLSAYYLIDAFTGAGIDQSVLYFVQTGLRGAPISEITGYIPPVVAFLLLAIAAAYGSYRLVRVKAADPIQKARAAIGSFILLLAFILNPAVNDIAALARHSTSEAGSGSALGGTPQGYVSVLDARFQGQSKSFVYLYLESFERTFLDSSLFPGLAPNLIALEKEALTFTDITQIPGTTYTIAGQVASQCGIPLAGAGTGSDLYLPGAKCIGDLLSDNSYVLSYMDGAASEFAGTGTLYHTHGFETVEGQNELQVELEDPTYQSFWGLFDDSLLSLALERIETVAARTQRFGYFVQTTDTHDPNGEHIPASCDNYLYQDGSNRYLNSIHCADKLAGDFIRAIRSNPQLKDVVIVVASDHLARPNTVSDTLEQGTRRNLLMVLGEDVPFGANDRLGTTLDIAPTLLTLLGAETPAVAYGRNLLAQDPTLREANVAVEKILDTDYAFLLTLWSFPQIGDGIILDATNNRLLLGNRYVELPALFYLNDDLEISYVSYQPLEGVSLTSYLLEIEHDIPFVYVDHCNLVSVFTHVSSIDPNRQCVLAGRLGNYDVGSFTLSDGVLVSTESMMPYLEQVAEDSTHYDQQISSWAQKIEFAGADVISVTPPNFLVGEVSIRSAAFPDWNSWIIDRTTGAKIHLTRGMTLMGFNEGEPPVKIAHDDTCAYGGKVFDPDVGIDQNFQTEIEKNQALFGAIVIVSHSSVICYGTDAGLEELFAGTPFVEWSKLTHYQPYVAILAGNDSIQEILGEFEVSLGVELKDFIRPAEIVQRDPL